MSGPITHQSALPTHQQVLPQPLACDAHDAAVWLGLIEPGTARDSLEAQSAQRTVRDWLRKGRLGGIWTGNRWIIPHSEIAAFLERLSPPDASKVAS